MAILGRRDREGLSGTGGLWGVCHGVFRAFGLRICLFVLQPGLESIDPLQQRFQDVRFWAPFLRDSICSGG